MKFADLQLSALLLDTVAAEGYHTATDIQARTIPEALAGRDVLGCAQTGTGKTAAFALPILHRLDAARTDRRDRRPRALVLAPTRELAQQIADSFKTYGRGLKVSGTVIYGGVGQTNQVAAMRRGVDVVVATPGRLLDLINQGHVDLSRIDTFVLDEADRMLDMGFMPDIKRIISHLPDRKQTLLFSATMPGEIRRLADALLHEPAEVTIAPERPVVDRIRQSVYHVDKPAKAALLAELMQSLPVSRAIVFTRTKHGADRVTRQLRRGGTSAEAIHGNKSQNARRDTLDRFRAGKLHALVATDIAARGIDVDAISHVFNYDIARDAESHIHRIGRTARAGADGAAISFCDREEVPYLHAIERLINMELEVIGKVPAHAHRQPGSRGPKQNQAKAKADRRSSSNRFRRPGKPSSGGGPGRRRRGRSTRSA